MPPCTPLGDRCSRVTRLSEPPFKATLTGGCAARGRGQYRSLNPRSSLSERINRLPKWARDYIHHVQTFGGAPEVEELTFLRDERKMLVKLIAEQKAEIRRLGSDWRSAVPAEPDYLDVAVILPHEIVADVDCCGCLVAIRRGDQAEIRCNECDALIETAPLDELQTTISRLALPMWQTVTSQRCPHCGALNVLPGFSSMEAYICKECGEGVRVGRAVQ